MKSSILDHFRHGDTLLDTCCVAPAACSARRISWRGSDAFNNGGHASYGVHPLGHRDLQRNDAEQNMERAGKRISFYDVGVKITRSKQCNGNVLCRQGSVISLPNRTAVLLVRYGAVICGGPPVTMLALSELLLKL